MEADDAVRPDRSFELELINCMGLAASEDVTRGLYRPSELNDSGQHGVARKMSVKPDRIVWHMKREFHLLTETAPLNDERISPVEPPKQPIKCGKSVQVSRQIGR